MSQLDLNKHTDREIVTAFLNLRIDKFMSVFNAIGAVCEKMTRRGKLIGQNRTDEETEDLIKRLFEGKAGDEN